ncbi:MAG: M23 family metallopeptidase [Acidimicrobiales bacterium]
MARRTLVVKRLVPAFAALVALATAGGWPGTPGASVAGAIGATATTTTIAPTTTTTVAAAGTTTTVAAPATTRPVAPTTTTAAPAAGGPAPPSTTAPSTTTTTTLPPHVDPATAAAYPGSLARSGANNTGALLDALKALEALGFSPDDAIRQGFGHFPVGGYASFRDDFGDFRAGPPVHTHEGNDVFAAFNTPVRAPFDGVVRYGSDPLGGLAVYLTEPDGTYFYICHLNAYAPDVTSGSTVAQGRVIGLVGDTGDAQGGAPHAHFEVHPKGGAAVDPAPLLNQWLAEALAAVPSLIGGVVQDQPAVLQATGLTRRFDMHDLDRRAQAPVEPLLWASSVNPAGSALRLAELSAGRLAGGIDWAAEAARAQAAADAIRQADENARLALLRLTPGPLAAILGVPRG